MQQKLGALFENRSLRQTVAKNAFWLITGQVITRTLKFLVTAYAARLLGVEAMGSLAYAVALTTLSFTFSDVGAATLLVREYQHADNKALLVRTLFKAKVGFLALSTLVALIAFTLFGAHAPKELLLLMLGVMIFDSTRDFVVAIARAKEKTQWEAVILAAEGGVTLALGIAALLTYGTITALAAGYLGASLITLLTAIIVLGNAFTQKETANQKSPLQGWLHTMWPFAAAAAIAVAFTQADTVMVGWLRGAYDAGLYGAASRIMQILLTLPALMGTALLPTLARFRQEPAKQAAALRETLSGVLLLIIPLTLGGIVLATPVLVLVYGQAFAAGGSAFALLLASLLCFTITTILDFLLLSQNLQAKNFTYTAIAAIFGITLNVLLIPTYGPAGAAGASLAAQVLNLALTSRLAYRTLQASFLSAANVVRITCAATIMAIAVWWLNINTIPRIALGVVIYGVIILILKTPFVYETIRRVLKTA